jgi:hypothetical protein
VTIDPAAFSLLNNCLTSTPFGMWWSAKTAVEVKANNEVINARKIFMMMCPLILNLESVELQFEVRRIAPFN